MQQGPKISKECQESELNNYKYILYGYCMLFYVASLYIFPFSCLKDQSCFIFDDQGEDSAQNSRKVGK